MAKFLNAAGVSQIWELVKERDSLRNNDFNYKPTFVPKAGQVCFVDTARNGLQIKIGDGVKAWSELNYLTATEEAYGLIKLYQSKGQNIDGTMSQKAITDELNTKFSVEMSGDETVHFYINN